MKLIADIGFNRNDDKEEYGTEDKIVRVCRFKEEEQHKIGVSFELGRKKDDTLNLTFDLAELLTAIVSCEEEE